jgi:hypothetical protein
MVLKIVTITAFRAHRRLANAPIAEVIVVILDDKQRLKMIEISTLETYEFRANNVIVPEFVDLLLTDLTVLLCNRILQHIRDSRSLLAACKARNMFSQICAVGVDHDVLALNPARDACALPLLPKKESALTSRAIGSGARSAQMRR